MKAVIKYISLLIFSGLILPLNINGRLCGPGHRETIAAPIVVVPVGKPEFAGYSFYRNIARKIFPALKF